MLATHERLQQDETACRQQLNWTRDHLLSQGEELRRMKEAWSESQAEEKIKEMVASEDGQLFSSSPVSHLIIDNVIAARRLPDPQPGFQCGERIFKAETSRAGAGCADRAV